MLLFAVGLLASVAIHEFGHFYPARKFGVRVSQFMVGFGPTLFSRKRGETEFGIKAIPLGGYVRIIGMLPPKPELTRGPFKNLINQTRSTSMADIRESDSGRTFYQLHPAKKLVVMLGGPVMNLVTAVVLLFIAFVLIGTPQPTTKVAEVINCLPTAITQSNSCEADAELSPAAKIKLQPADQILAIDNIATDDWDQLVSAIDAAAGQRVVLKLLRGEFTSSVSVEVADISTAGKQDGYDEMIGDTVDLTGSFGPTTALGATIPSKTCNLPLPFFFSRDSGVSLPTSALLFNELKINFKLRDWDKLLILDNSGSAGAGTVARAVPVVGRDIATTPVISSISCWSNQALVSEFERSRMACTVRDIVIENHQSAARLQYSPISSPNFIAEPKFIFAVRALFMAVRNTTFENEWSNYTTNSPYNSGSIINYKPSTTTAPIQDVTLNYDSTTRLSEMGWDYFSHINPYYSTNVIPREIGYGVYSYALDLASIDPNGSTNFSKIGNVAIQIRPSQQALTAAAGSGAATTGSDFPQKYTWINFVLSNQVIRIADGQLTFPYV